MKNFILLISYFIFLNVVQAGSIDSSKQAPRQPVSQPPAQTPSAELTGLEAELKTALTEQLKRMPSLESWQRVIYSEEILPQYRRFIQDYKKVADRNLSVDIDSKSISDYLKFYGPKYFNTKEVKFLVSINTDQFCVPCKSALPAIQQLIQSRVTRRGMVPVVVFNKDIPSTLLGRPLDEQLSTLAKQKNARGYLAVQWGLAPQDDEDTVHADEKKYLIQSHLQVGDSSPLSRKKEIFEEDSLETAEARLLTDLFTDLGGQLKSGIADSERQNQEELSIVITGIRDFAHYNRLKEALQTRLGEDTPLEERILAQGQITLALHSPISREELRKKIAQIGVTSEGDEPVTVVVK